jgi:DNA (cytosine-5)-methyltransferase 1
MRTAWFAEVDPYASAVLRKHWPEVPNHGDVRNIGRGTVCPVDVLCGGFPCQDISNAGKRAGIDGERSGLWGEFARIIGELRPRFVIVENVAALLGRGIERVLGDLAALGFDAEWHCIPASAVGAPHRRDRVWIVAYADGREQGRREFAQRLEDQRNADVAGDGAQGAMADAERRRCGADDTRSAVDTARERFTAGGGEVVADADGERGRLWSTGRENAANAWESSRRAQFGTWELEPDVGRVAHGVPAELDGGRYAEKEHDAQGGAQGNSGSLGVPGMQRDGEARAPSSRLLAADIGRGLVSAVSRQGGPAGRDASDEGDAEMRSLRERFPADAQQETQPLQRGVPFDRWPHERGETVGQVWDVEPDVGRVAHGVENRIDRLRCLGNAIVPQVAEIIGRAIVSAA